MGRNTAPANSSIPTLFCSLQIYIKKNWWRSRYHLFYSIDGLKLAALVSTAEEQALCNHLNTRTHTSARWIDNVLRKILSFNRHLTKSWNGNVTKIDQDALTAGSIEAKRRIDTTQRRVGPTHTHVCMRAYLLACTEWASHRCKWSYKMMTKQRHVVSFLFYQYYFKDSKRRSLGQSIHYLPNEENWYKAEGGIVFRQWSKD